MPKRKGKGRRNEPPRTDVLDKLEMENERFVTYYRAQNIIPEEEWDSFMDSLRQHLPTTFRVAGSRLTANTLNATIAKVHVPALSEVDFEGVRIPPPVQIPWYPDGLAWQFNVPKKVLRKSPEFKKFHSFLVSETEVGNISRQEAVSMLPPLFLDVQPHHKVMDMCAAPGSKTAQILEALHINDTLTSSSIPTGLLLANDSDNKRTHLLIHQSARLPSPALMVTNLDASNYPSIRVPVKSKDGVPRLEPLRFDRILCDVPCSGDGTMRKNVGIWKTWQPNDGNGLHSLQVRILERAMRLLAPSGRIVYSTCSLNPVENEAVVAEALNSNKGFQLVDVSSMLPELCRRPGLKTWKVTSDRLCQQIFDTQEELLASSLDEAMKSKVTPGHWPPANASELNLERCMRVYPHLQDSGGFFVAVLERKNKPNEPAPIERKRSIPEEEEARDVKRPKLSEDTPDDTPPTPEAPVDEPMAVEGPLALQPEGTESAAPTASVTATTKGNNGWFKENPYTFLPDGDPVVRSCLERLHIDPKAFPLANILVRNPDGDAARSLYIANDIVKTIIQNNEYTRIRLTSAGTKIFGKQEAAKGTDTQFRILGEGLPIVLPYIDPSTILEADVECLKILIQTHYPLCSRFQTPFRDVLEAAMSGSQIVRFKADDTEDAMLKQGLVLPIWKSNVSVTLMIDKKAKSALSLRLFGGDITTPPQERGAPQTEENESTSKPNEA